MKASLGARVGTTVASAAFLIMLGNVASRLLGLVREQVIVALFGRTGVTDAFVASITVPTMVYDLVVGGAVSAALIPVFSQYAASRDDRTLWRVASSILTIAFIVLSASVIVLWLLAEELMGFLGFGFAPEYRALAVELVRLALPAVIFLGLSGIFSALLYARQIFVYSAFSIAAYNAGIIAAALLLAAYLGPASLVVGVLLGALLQVVLQLPGLRGMRLRPALDLRHPGVRRVLILYAPVALGLVVSQVGVVIDRNLASQAGEGSMTAMRLATTLVQLPLGLVVTAAAYAVLPSLSRFAAGLLGDDEEEGDPAAAADAYRSTLLMGIRFCLFFILPAMVGLIALRGPVISLLFERGAFGANDTAQTAWILLFYLPQLPFVAIDQLLIFAFYARKNTLTPMLVGVLGVGVYLVAGVSLLGPMQAAGLALANTLQHTVHALVLFVLLERTIRGLAGRRLFGPLGKLALAAALCGLVLFGLSSPLAGLFDLTSALGQLAYLAVMTAAGGAAYLGATFSLRCEEPGLALSLLRRLAARARPG